MKTVKNDENVVTRKVQNIGGSSSLISLPKNWVKKNGIKKGDTLMVEEFPNGDLRIYRTHQLNRLQEVPEINIDNLGKKELEAIIMGNYLMGIDYFKITTSLESLSTSKRKIISKSLKNLLGFRVISESPSSIGIKNVLDPSNFNVREEAKRLGILTFFMLKDLIQALKEKNFEAAKEIIDQDEEMDRSYLIMRRLLMIACNNAVVAKKIGVEDSNFVIVWSIILKKIETVADNIVEIIKILDSLDFTKIPEEIFDQFIKIGGQLLFLFDAFLKLYYDKDFEGTFDVRGLDLFSEMKNNLTEKEIKYSLEPSTIIVLEKICFFFEEIVKYIKEQVRDYVHYEMYFK
ncbi:MAG: PhoU domain-containing protein [Candidatus Lokiarchaeia archaeon]